MDAVRIGHDPAVVERFPEHFTGVLRVAGAGPIVPRPAALETLKRQVKGTDGLAAARRAAARWPATFAAQGARPKYRSSVERLLELFETEGAIAAPLALVELYCWYSLAHGVPMGGYRVQRLSGRVTLTMPGKGHSFTPLGQPHGSPERTRNGEVALVDEQKVLCRYWNYRDCDETKLVAEQRDVLFCFDFRRDTGDTPAQARATMAGFAELLTGDAHALGLLTPDDGLDAELAPN